MSSDFDRFLRAVRTLAKLAWKYDKETWLNDLGRYATVKQESDVWFVGDYLDEIGMVLSKRRVEPRCRQCGDKINIRRGDDEPDARADAQYCGPKCRQRAYRGRVTASAPKRKRKRNGNGISLRLDQQTAQRAVTTAVPSSLNGRAVS